MITALPRWMWACRGPGVGVIIPSSQSHLGVGPPLGHQPSSLPSSYIPETSHQKGEGHGNPLLYSCLENPMDRGVGQATIHRAAKSRTRLKQFSMHKNYKNLGLTPGLKTSPGGGHGNPPQYSCLENPRDRGALRAIGHRVAQSQTQLKRGSTRACKS